MSELPLDPPEYPAYCDGCEQVISRDWDDLTETRSGLMLCADCFAEHEDPYDE